MRPPCCTRTTRPARTKPHHNRLKEEPPAASFRFPSFKEATEAYHREFIQRKLEEADGNVSRAAELMGVDRSHLYRRMRALGIQNRERNATT